MIHFTIAAALSAAALTRALPNGKRQEAASVEWGECEFEHPNQFKVPIECGTLAVPLDYTEEDGETLSLNLLRVKATKEPTLGSMLFNPGGPGESGITALLGSLPNLQIASGGQYDLIGFDPRCTGRTLPANCNDAGSSGPTKRDGPLFAENVMDVAERIWTKNAELLEQCSTTVKDIGEYVGTAYVARDMARIVDALEDDGMLRYFGASYGTLLGWTFAAMFPDRVGRMILDANINPVDYWNGMDLDGLNSDDDTFMVILEACFEAGDECPLAEYGDAESVREALNEVLENWKPIPNPASPAESGDMMQVADVKFRVQQPMYKPAQYFAWSQTLLKLIKTPEEAFASPGGADAPATGEAAPEPWSKSDATSALLSIRCGDWPIRADDPSELEGLFEMLNHGSWADMSANDWLNCYRWPLAAKERYTDGFEISPANPILYVNPTWDPATPLTSARNSSSTMEGSVVLEHRAPGHTSFGVASKCTMQHMRDYMVEGTVPEDGTVCEADMPFFKNWTAITYALEVFTVWQDLTADAKAVDVVAALESAGQAGDDAGNGTTGESGAAQEENSASPLRASLLAAAGLVAAFMATL